jgi:cytoskeletal protein RodZ
MTKDEHPVSIGEFLRARRLEQGLSLEELATSTRIRLSHLQALEEGRFEELPGEAYRRGFLRTYAGALGLDPQEVLERYLGEVGHGSESTPVLSERAVEFPAEIAVGGRYRWPFRLVLIALLLAAGLWWLQADRGRREEDRSAKPPAPEVSTNAPTGEGVGPAMENATGAAESHPTPNEPDSEPADKGAETPAGQNRAGADETAIQTGVNAGASAVKQAQPQEGEDFRAELPPKGARVKLETLERCSILVSVDDQAPRRYDLPAGAVLRWPVRVFFELKQERPGQVKVWVGDRTLDISTARHAVLERSSDDGGGGAQ